MNTTTITNNSRQGGRISLCKSKKVSRQELESIPVPMYTDTYKPVAYANAVSYMHEMVQSKLGLSIIKEQYGLARQDSQLFGLITLDTGNKEHGLSIGIRQSYNKSMALGVAIGAQVFVCDNLCFSDSAFKIVRKNTSNVWQDFKSLILQQIDDSFGHYEEMSNDINALKAAPCDLTRGYELLGRMQGMDLLRPRQASVAFADWQAPRHNEFSERNLWGLYNAVTEGLKKGPQASVLDRHSQAHSFFLSAV